MIKTTFAELKVGNEFHYRPEICNFTVHAVKKSEKLATEPAHSRDFSLNKNSEVWVSIFKDRFGKDLSTDDRVLIVDDSETVGLDVITIVNIEQSRFIGSNNYYHVYSSTNKYRSVHYSSIVKIEPNWGI